MQWINFYAFAQAMKEAPKVVRVRKAFDLADPAKPLQRDLSQITAMASPVLQHPLLMGYQLARLPPVQAFVENEEHEKWLRDLNEVGGALMTAIEFIRSRIAGYPSLRVPHLRTGSPYTYAETFLVAGFPWDAELRRMGLQLQGPPPVGQILESQADFQSLLNAASDELNASDASASFAAARAAMQPSDWDQLRELGRTFAGRVTDDAVTAAAGDFLLQRFQCGLSNLGTVGFGSRWPSANIYGCFRGPEQTLERRRGTRRNDGGQRRTGLNSADAARARGRSRAASSLLRRPRCRPVLASRQHSPPGRPGLIGNWACLHESNHLRVETCRGRRGPEAHRAGRFCSRVDLSVAANSDLMSNLMLAPYLPFGTVNSVGD